MPNVAPNMMNQLSQQNNPFMYQQNVQMQKPNFAPNLNQVAQQNYVQYQQPNFAPKSNELSQSIKLFQSSKLYS